MSYDRSFGADRHDLGSRVVMPEDARPSLAARAVLAFRSALRRAPAEAAASRGHAALDRIAGATARGSTERATAVARK